MYRQYRCRTSRMNNAQMRVNKMNLFSNFLILIPFVKSSDYMCTCAHVTKLFPVLSTCHPRKTCVITYMYISMKSSRNKQQRVCNLLALWIFCCKQVRRVPINITYTWITFSCLQQSKTYFDFPVSTCSMQWCSSECIEYIDITIVLKQ